MNRLILKVYSDYICPFSYLLFRKIERLKKELPVDVEWYPLLSHPEIPEGGLPLNKLLKDDNQIKDAVESVSILARREGIELQIPQRVSSSKLAIWMAECARQNGKFDEYHKRVYDVYFQEGKDIGDDKTIPEIIKDLKIPKKAIASFCKDRKGYGRSVTERLLECKEHKINKVPTIILGEEKIEGSWPYPILYEAVETALKAV
jgi:predicted DsbA family dithiol-disulfide isomerase